MTLMSQAAFEIEQIRRVVIYFYFKKVSTVERENMPDFPWYHIAQLNKDKY